MLNTNNDQHKSTHKTEALASRSPQKNRDELR